MLRLYLLVILLTHKIRTAHVTDRPFLNRFEELYKKLEKLDRFNTVSPDRVEFADEDEDMLFLTAMRELEGLSAEQMDGVVKDLQGMKAERDDDQEYSDSPWEDEDDGDYPLNDDWDSEDVLADSSSTARPVLGVTPSAMVIARPDPARNVVSAAESIAATNARPRILYDPLTPAEKTALRSALRLFFGSGKCLVPQPRWLTVRQLAPAADTSYLPPCVQLHRCAADSGCCINEGEVCAPVNGNTVTIPFYLHKATEANAKVVKMQFFNHTQCACVPRSTLQMTIRSRVNKLSYSDSQEDQERPTRRAQVESQNDWRAPTEEPNLEKEEEPTAPPQLRRCTCPALFLASMSDNEPCSCICDWPDPARRRDCQILAKGREHFGLRDRVCVARGDCTHPTCEYGAYDKTNGKCPVRRYRRMRYHTRGRYQEKTMVV